MRTSGGLHSQHGQHWHDEHHHITSTIILSVPLFYTCAASLECWSSSTIHLNDAIVSGQRVCIASDDLRDLHILLQCACARPPT